MKKITFIVAVIAVAMFTSCKGKATKEKTITTDIKTKIEAYLTPEIKTNLDSLVATMKQLDKLPLFVHRANGKYQLTEKAKKVKPDYLLSLEKAKGFTTRSEKAAAIGMYMVDMAIQDIYEMPNDEHKAVIKKLFIEAGLPVLDFDAGEIDRNKHLELMYKESLKSKSTDVLFTLLTASLLESLYANIESVDIISSVFTDADVQNTLTRLQVLNEAISALIPYHPEMNKLNTVLMPVYGINATTVKEFESELLRLKKDVITVREYMINTK